MKSTQKPEKTVVLVIGGTLKQFFSPMGRARSLESGVTCLISGTPTDQLKISPAFCEN